MPSGKRVRTCQIQGVITAETDVVPAMLPAAFIHKKRATSFVQFDPARRSEIKLMVWFGEN
jgi:hypothetical protein